MASIRGKLTVHATRGGQKKSYNIGGFVIDGKYFVGQDMSALALGIPIPEYAIYTLDGKIKQGGFDTSREAKNVAHLLFVKEKFKV